MTEHSPELQRLLDRQAILDCLHRYTRGLDRHDDELLKSAFHEDAVDHHGDFVGNARAFIEWSADLHTTQPWSAHMHLLDCNHIDIEGDTAHSECYVSRLPRRKDDTAVEIGGGRYIDRLERRDGDWKIAARQLVIEWTAKAEAEAFADVASYPRGTWDRTYLSHPRPFELHVP